MPPPMSNISMFRKSASMGPGLKFLSTDSFIRIPPYRCIIVRKTRRALRELKTLPKSLPDSPEFRRRKA